MRTSASHASISAGTMVLPRIAAALPLVPGTAVEAAPWTPTDVPGRVVDVRRFGAKGDGVTIDSDAVNRAIDEAAKARPNSGGGPGGTVYFPAGG